MWEELGSRHLLLMNDTESLLRSQRLHEGLRSCISQWETQGVFATILYTGGQITATTCRANLSLLREASFPAPSSLPAFRLQIRDYQVLFLDSAVDVSASVEDDTVRVSFRGHRAHVFSSSLPDAAHEVYVRLRQDGVPMQEALTLSRLLEVST